MNETASEKPCVKCGQVNIGQTGEYPCATCGFPSLWDESIPRATFESVGTLRGLVERMAHRCTCANWKHAEVPQHQSVECCTCFRCKFDALIAVQPDDLAAKWLKEAKACRTRARRNSSEVQLMSAIDLETCALQLQDWLLALGIASRVPPDGAQ